MKGFVRGALIAAIALPFAAMDAAAQAYRFDVGLKGGGAFWTKTLSDDELGENTEDVKFKQGWLTGADLTFWFRDRIGVRANLGYTERPLHQERTVSTVTGDDNLINDVNLWSGSGDLLFSFANRPDSWGGTEIAPYVALGIGAKWINPSGDHAVVQDTEENKEWNGVAFTPESSAAIDPSYVLGENNSLMGLLGLGTQIRFTPNLALSLEIGDRMFKTPIYGPVTNVVVPGAVITVANDERLGKMTHELYGEAGLHFLFGLDRPEPVAVVAAPAPRPTPMPAPTPAPVIEERTTEVCVIDPSSDMGVRTVTAYTTSGSDLMVMSNGQRVPLNSTLGNVTVASNSDWFIQGQPLAMTFGSERTQFTTYGNSRMIESSDLAYLGTVNGVPVYADRADVSNFSSSLIDARRNRGNELRTAVTPGSDIATGIRNLRVVYVPLQPTGCVFQAMQRVEEVRKNR
jgi:hypothetical protein